MLEQLIQFDKELFLTLNGINAPWADTIFYYITNKYTWIPLYAVLLYALYKKQGLTATFGISIAAVILLITATDQITYNVFKQGLERLRPCHDPELIQLVHLVTDRCGGMYGFVSGHSANSFAAAYFVVHQFNKKWLSASLFIWAAVVAYSRVYVGVHFPGDIFFGAIIGLFIAAGVVQFQQWATKKWVQ